MYVFYEIVITCVLSRDSIKKFDDDDDDDDLYSSVHGMLFSFSWIKAYKR